MTLTIAISALELAPGSTVSIHDLSWADFETLLVELGEKRHTRIAYYRGTLEIMSPLAIHERPHHIIAYVLTTILEIQGRNWEDFGSTTLKRPEVAGVEPDTCFYNELPRRKQRGIELPILFDHTNAPRGGECTRDWIQNADRVRGCTDLDLDDYPPPDLAIEADVTSITAISAYQVMRVPEIWVYRNHQLKIYLLDSDRYVESGISPTFADLPIAELIPQLVQQAIAQGTSRMLRELRTQFSS